MTNLFLVLIAALAPVGETDGPPATSGIIAPPQVVRRLPANPIQTAVTPETGVSNLRRTVARERKRPIDGVLGTTISQNGKLVSQTIGRDYVPPATTNSAIVRRIQDVPPPNPAARVVAPQSSAGAPSPLEDRAPPEPFTNTFEQSCHFNKVHFGLMGEQYESEAVLINEGMELTIFEDGRYELRMTALTNGTAATMRFAFQLTNQHGTTISLNAEPITLLTTDQVTPIDEEPRLRKNDPWHSFDIVQVGYRPFFVGVRPGTYTTITRTGSARLGSLAPRTYSPDSY